MDVDYALTTTVDFALYETPYPVQSATAVEISADSVRITWVPDASRELLGYTIYRQVELQEPPFTVTQTEIGTTTAAIMFDDMWGAQEPGVYSWYVVSNYTANNSEPVFTNTLDKDMETMVDFTVTTEFGDSPEATVTFTNTSEPDLELEYSTTLPASGEGSFDPFRKGTYDIEVSLYGYETQTVTDVDIWEETTFTWELVGGTPAPENLVAENDSLYMGEDAKIKLGCSSKQRI